MSPRKFDGDPNILFIDVTPGAETNPYRFRRINVQEPEFKTRFAETPASDGRKYTAGNIDRSRYDRLVDLGWLTPFKTNISDVEYQATEKGRAAARPLVVLAPSESPRAGGGG